MRLGIEEFEDWARARGLDLSRKPTTESKFMAFNFPAFVDPITQATWDGYQAANQLWQNMCVPQHMAALRVLDKHGLIEEFHKVCEEDAKLMERMKVKP